MNKKALLSTLAILLLLGSFSVAKADTVLFPVVATNPPNVTTIISVTNQGPSSDFLTYIYSYKPTFLGGGAPNYSGGCSVQSFVQPTFAPDIVSFDVSATFNEGFALFNDPDSYTSNFDLALPQGSGPQRAYLLVTNSDESGNRVDVGATSSLRGEAVLLDILFGAAWGYKAINDTSGEDFSFLSVSDNGALVNVMNPTLDDSTRFTFFPFSDWTTRFFVTPVGFDMDITDLASTLRLYQTNPIVPGINGRGGDMYSFNIPQTVVCTGAVNLTDLLDSTAFSALENTGGWGRISVDSGDAAVIYKLEFVVNNPTFGGTNNNGFLLSGID